MLPIARAAGRIQVMNAPILDRDGAASLAASWRAAGYTVVFTNGHFDLLHVGHLHYLQTAHDLGDRLLVGINSDASTRQRKGPGRPVIAQTERATLLAALRCVDGVIIFESIDCRDLVAAIQPQIYVKGADWNRPDGPRPPEAEVVQGYGGRVAYVELLPEQSTTAIIASIRQGASRAGME